MFDINDYSVERDSEIALYAIDRRTPIRIAVAHEARRLRRADRRRVMVLRQTALQQSIG